MKKVILAALMTVIVSLTAGAKSAPDTYFPYPLVPDSIQTLEGRSNFLISHFWDFCDLKKSFSSRAKMAESFSDYLSFMPYASAKVVHRSIARFIKELEKQPDDLVFIARTAEQMVHSDSSRIFSDELYLPFALAVVNNKRVKKEDKAYFEPQVKVLNATMLNTRMPDISYIDRNGSKAVFSPDSTDIVLLFFTEPGDSKALLAKARLNADSKATNFIKNGMMKVVAIAKMQPGEEWLSFAKTIPEDWIAGTNPDIDSVYDIRFTPSFYVVDNGGNILLKNASIDQVISILEKL
ncbi:MAG: DUF5106 domain-containing protein [Paramuribaculum sp.]|nr:DUF5106 domain-containing protein [Paramuribaculum sp.]